MRRHRNSIAQSQFSVDETRRLRSKPLNERYRDVSTAILWGQSLRWSPVTALKFDEPPSNLCFGKRSEEHTSELQSLSHLECRLLLEKKKNQNKNSNHRPPGPDCENFLVHA